MKTIDVCIYSDHIEIQDTHDANISAAIKHTLNDVNADFSYDTDDVETMVRVNRYDAYDVLLRLSLDFNINLI